MKANRPITPTLGWAWTTRLDDGRDVLCYRLYETKREAQRSGKPSPESRAVRIVMMSAATEAERRRARKGK